MNVRVAPASFLAHPIVGADARHFRHLINLRREAGFNAVSLLQGYPAVRIVSPLELIHGNDEDKDL